MRPRQDFDTHGDRCGWIGSSEVARLVIRRLSASARRELRRRATRHRRSLAAEARAILEQVAQEPEILDSKPEPFPDGVVAVIRRGIAPAVQRKRPLAETLLGIGERYAALPTDNERSEEEILGQDIPGNAPEDEA